MSREPESAPVTDSTITEQEWNVEADALKKYGETRRLYAKSRHDDAVAKRVVELIAADSDIPPPADQELLLENMASQVFEAAKRNYLENVAKDRALKMLDTWRKTAPKLECEHRWVDQHKVDGPRQRCERCGEPGPTRKLRSA